MGLIGKINIDTNGIDIKDFENKLYALGTQESNQELSMLQRVESLYKTILRGKDSYEEFLKLLRDLDAPKEYNAFFNFFIKSLYVDDDFYAIISIIEQNRDKFNGLHCGKVLECISLEVYNDFVRLK